MLVLAEGFNYRASPGNCRDIDLKAWNLFTAMLMAAVVKPFFWPVLLGQVPQLTNCQMTQHAACLPDFKDNQSVRKFSNYSKKSLTSSINESLSKTFSHPNLNIYGRSANSSLPLKSSFVHWIDRTGHLFARSRGWTYNGVLNLRRRGRACVNASPANHDHAFQRNG